MMETITKGSKVEVLRGRHKGQTGALYDIREKFGHQVYVVRMDSEKNVYAFFGTGDLKPIQP